MWKYVFLLTCIEVGGTCFITRFANDTTRLASLAVGVSAFGLLGVALAIAIQTVGHMSVVNALWQSISIIMLSLISLFYFEESMSMRQCTGVVLATLASICFYESDATVANVYHNQAVESSV